MRSVQHRDVAFSDLARTIWRCRWRCAATMIVVLGLTAAYAVLAPPSWMASQAIIVRNDATAQFGATGRLREDEDVKNTQETLQEIVTSRSVLRNSLQRVGPAGRRFDRVLAVRGGDRRPAPCGQFGPAERHGVRKNGRLLSESQGSRSRPGASVDRGDLPGTRQGVRPTTGGDEPERDFGTEGVGGADGGQSRPGDAASGRG